MAIKSAAIRSSRNNLIVSVLQNAAFEAAKCRILWRENMVIATRNAAYRKTVTGKQYNGLKEGEQKHKADKQVKHITTSKRRHHALIVFDAC